MSGSRVSITARAGAWLWPGLIIGVACVSAVCRLAWLFSTNAAMGRDGYYYLLQLDSIRRGDLHALSMTSVPAFLMVAVRPFLGNDIATVKIVAAAGSFLLVLAAATLAAALAKRWEAGLVAAVLTASAPSHNWFVIEFINNLYGMVLGLSCAVLMLLLGRRSTPARLGVPLLAALFVLGCASHLSAAVMIAIVAVTHSLTRSQDARPVAGRRLTAACVLVTLMLVGWRLAAAGVALPLSDGAAPVLGAHLSRNYSAIILLVVSWILVRLAVDRQPKPWAFLFGDATGIVIGLLAVGVLYAVNPLLGYHQTPYTIPDRLSLWAWLICAVLGGALVFEGGRLTSRSLVRGTALSLAIVWAGLEPGIPPGADPRYLAQRERLVRALRQVPAEAFASQTVIAEHGDQFVVSYVTGARARSTRPAPPRQASLWLVDGIPAGVRRPAGAIVTDRYVFLPDHQFTKWLDGLEPQDRAAVVRANPYHIGRDVLHVAPGDSRRR